MTPEIVSEKRLLKWLGQNLHQIKQIGYLNGKKELLAYKIKKAPFGSLFYANPYGLSTCEDSHWIQYLISFTSCQRLIMA
jgi:hypothetical protein